MQPHGIVLSYAVLAAFWIFFSDRLLENFVDPATILHLSTAKGFAFISVTSLLLHLLLKRRRESGPAARADEDMQPASVRGIVLLLAALALVVPLVCFAIVKLYGAQIERDADASLEFVARLKTEQIENWFVERDSDTRAMMADPGFVERIAAMQRSDGARLQEEITIALEALRQTNDYTALLLLDAEGKPLLALGERIELAAETAPLVRKALDSGEARRSDFFLDRDYGKPALDYVVPLLPQAKSGKRQPVAAVVLRVDPERFLFPAIRAWYSPSASAETVLVRREGESVVILNATSYRQGGTLMLKRPLAGSELSAAAASRAADSGTLRGRDYRGTEVLAAYRPLKNTDWHIVAKIDRAEVLAPLWERVLWVGLITLVVVVALGAALLLLWRQRQRARRLAHLVRESNALADSARHIRAVAEAVEQSPVSIVITSRDGAIEYTNPRFTRVTGFSREEALGQNPRLLKSGVTPDAVYRELWQNIASGKEWRGILRNRRKNGELFWEEASISPIFSEQGEITHFVAIKEDITERKQIEQQLLDQQAHLEDEVQSRTADLTQALQAAKHADRAKDEFLANVSHELRTPLNAVIGLAWLARLASQDERQHDYLDKISAAGKSLSHTINDLLDLSKIAAGHLEFEVTAFSLRQLIRRSRSVIEHNAAEKGLTLSEHIDAAVPDVLVGDPQRLEQILLNLLSNAIKFTASGGVAVRIGLHECTAERVALNIEVEDSGIGLREEDIERLFKPFAQADASVSRKYGGTGLGLAICRHLTKLMDGDIGVTSRLGSGTTIRVRVWLGLGTAADLRQSPPVADTAPLPAAYRDARVLVAEDQPLNREIVEALLRVVGIEADMVGNGREALDLLLACGPGTFDLVLMDIQMPEMDGISATRALRAWAGYESLPVVAMTAHTMEHEKQMGTAAGMNDHIGKPFETASFYRLLAKWLPAAKQQQVQLALPATPAGLPALPGVDVDSGLARFAGDAARYRRWLANFATEAPAYAAQIRAALADGQPEVARKTAHAIKGRAGMLGMMDLHAIAGALEAALQRGETTADLLDQLHRACMPTCAAIKELEL